MRAQMKSMAMIRKQPIPKWRQRGGDPDVEQAPDAEGKVGTRQARVARALPVRDTAAGDSEDFFSGYLAVVAIRLRRFPPQPQRRRAGRAVFDYADFTGTKRTPRFIRNSTIYL